MRRARAFVGRPGWAAWTAATAALGAASVASATLAQACDAHIVVGADPPETSAPAAGDDGGIGGDASLTPLVVPWSTGFEKGFADWSQPAGQGFCYLLGGATFAIVTSPVHTGSFAAAFTVNTGAPTPPATRCLRQGVFPAAAYYGAWFYVPAAATSRGNWNLLHFEGAYQPGGAPHGLWDVSLASDADGGIDTSVFDFLRARSLEAGAAIPIAQWFHLEVFLRRSDAGAGEFTLYRDDGQIVLQLTGLSTDDSVVQSWHVGNLATALSPPMSTIYVDDVTIDTNGP